MPSCDGSRQHCSVLHQRNELRALHLSLLSKSIVERCMRAVMGAAVGNNVENSQSKNPSSRIANAYFIKID